MSSEPNSRTFHQFSHLSRFFRTLDNMLRSYPNTHGDGKSNGGAVELPLRLSMWRRCNKAEKAPRAKTTIPRDPLLTCPGTLCNWGMEKIPSVSFHLYER